MSQQTYSGPGTAVAEPPAPILPAGFDDEDGGSDNRRKLMMAGAAAGVLVLVVVAFFLLKGGGSSPSADSFTVPQHHHAAKTATGAPGSTAAVTLPKIVTDAGGTDPFKPLYAPPPPKPAAPAQSATAPTTPTVPVSGPTGGTTPPVAAAYAPVWIGLVSVDGTKSATFVVGYSNGKSLRTTSYKNVVAPTSSLRTDFGNVFSLLSIQDGEATVQFGDGSPFDLLPGASHRHPLG
ncbi:MAG: hypothetical protein QOD07_62 [Frankiaceae bacterium]|jgi:hypothetical protein|nr:hypothetical protein [Frankiaceae bacterium]